MSDTKCRKGILVVISGFSGAGKGTLVKELLKKYPERYALSISATSRKPREGEVDGREYFFQTKEAFEQLIERDELIEYARYVDNYYGTPKQYVLEQLEKGKDVILEIEVQGALKIKAKFPDTVLLFVTPPNAETLIQRLRGRGTETEEVILQRMGRAFEEAQFMPEYEYLIVNDDLEDCVNQTHQTIENQHFEMHRNVNFIENMSSELKSFSKGE